MNENHIIIIIILIVVLVIFILRNFYLKETLLKEIEEKELSNKREKKTAEELEKSKIENLKFTLNPHSFKNTLQIIGHLAEKTYDSVNSLSGLFDYMLYDAKNQFVPIEQEVNFATEYLKLYRLRLKPTVNVINSIDKEHLYKWGKKKKIAPLIFAHFIENAFKHGDLNSSKAFIEIKIETLDQNTIIYAVKNKISETKSSNKGGIGNETFLKRLELLYKENFNFDYSIEDNVYSANLKLTIHDN